MVSNGDRECTWVVDSELLLGGFVAPEVGEEVGTSVEQSGFVLAYFGGNGEVEIGWFVKVDSYLVGAITAIGVLGGEGVGVRISNCDCTGGLGGAPSVGDVGDIGLDLYVVASTGRDIVAKIEFGVFADGYFYLIGSDAVVCVGYGEVVTARGGDGEALGGLACTPLVIGEVGWAC